MKRILLLLAVAFIFGSVMPTMAQKKKTPQRRTTQSAAPIKQRNHMEFLGLEMGGDVKAFEKALRQKGFANGWGFSNDPSQTFLRGNVYGMLSEICITAENNRVKTVSISNMVNTQAAATNRINRLKKEMITLYGGKWTKINGTPTLKLPYGEVTYSSGAFDSGDYELGMYITDNGKESNAPASQENVQKEKESEGNILGLEAPVWEKFAVSKGEYAPIYKTADENSPKLKNISYEDGLEWKGKYCWDNDEIFKSGKEYIEDVLPVGHNSCIFPVIEEKGNWIKILLIRVNGGNLEAYMKKSDCKIIRPAPITQEVLDHINHRSFSRDYIVPTGKLKSLCFSTCLAQRDNTYIEMGVLDHGRIIYNWNSVALNGSKKNTAVKILYDRNEEVYTLYYTARNTFRAGDYTGSDISMKLFDAKTLTGQQLTNLYDVFCKEKIRLSHVRYYFPDLDCIYEFIF